jgi:uncharacterized protein YkuJ
MSPDETLNDGEVYYAISTDARTTWKVAKNGEGERSIARNNSGTWQYNSAIDSVTENSFLQGAIYDNISFNVSAQMAGAQGISFKTDGSKMYTVDYTNDSVYQYTLSTPWDITTASYDNISLSVSSQDAVPRDIRFSSDGTKMYIVASTAPDSVYQYNLSTAWDLSTAVYSGNSFSVQGQTANPSGLTFNLNGSKMYVCEYGTSTPTYQYTLSTPWDITTASYDNISLSPTGAVSEAILIDNAGTKFFVLSNSTTDLIYQYTLSTPGDLSTASLDLTLDITSIVSSSTGLAFNDDQSKIFIIGGNEIIYQYSMGNNTVESYTTSEVWTNSTYNNEHSALQQALSISINRMNSNQLSGLSDANEFVLGNSLDLMIAPYLSSGTSPVSDGVTINYDAEAIIRQAILGTDYIVEQPSPGVVKVVSLTGQNLKIRVL